MYDDAAVLDQNWYVQPNDLIGGWSVMNVDKPPSQIDPSKGEYELGDFPTKRLAQEMVLGHLFLRAKYGPGGVMENLADLADYLNGRLASDS